MGDEILQILGRLISQMRLCSWVYSASFSQSVSVVAVILDR
jgi:hypothetical protein